MVVTHIFEKIPEMITFSTIPARHRSQRNHSRVPLIPADLIRIVHVMRS